MERFLRALGVTVLSITLFGFALVLLWNLVMVHLFHAPVIGFWEGVGMRCISILLFDHNKPNKVNSYENIT